MKRKLLLSSSGFPDKFISSGISSSATIPKQRFMEDKILETINIYNPKLNVSEIEYLDIRSQFPHLSFFGLYAGVIVEDFKINRPQRGYYLSKKYFVWETNGELFARKTVIYIIMSDFQESGRNIISQSFFPELIDFMNLYHLSPSFSIANHPIYYINFLDTEIRAASIIQQIAGMMASNVEHIEVFKSTLKLHNVPTGMRDFLKRYMTGFNPTDVTYSSVNYEINLGTMTTTIKTNKLILGDYIKLKNGIGPEYQFNGSSDKFYWMDIIPIIHLSCYNHYSVDYSQLESFCSLYRVHFGARDDKFQRFLHLLQFIKKITLQGL